MLSSLMKSSAELEQDAKSAEKLTYCEEMRMADLTTENIAG